MEVAARSPGAVRTATRVLTAITRAASVAHDRRSGMRPVSVAGSATTSVEVEYFAVLREHAGSSHESLATSASTLAEVYDELSARYGFPLERDVVRVAVNDEFVEWERPLGAGDRVAFIPPVAGG
jgi:sulfur-carrier protein